MNVAYYAKISLYDLLMGISRGRLASANAFGSYLNLAGSCQLVHYHQQLQQIAELIINSIGSTASQMCINSITEVKHQSAVFRK